MEEIFDRPDCPRLRAVEAFPVTVEGQQLICLRDPQHLAPEPLLLTYPAVFLISRFNGGNSLRDAQADFLRQFGELVPLEKIEELVSMLEAGFFLDSEAFRERLRRTMEEFRSQTIRPAMHAGSAYDSDPERLRLQMDAFFAHPEGAGSEPGQEDGPPLLGLVAPHIDFQRGGPTYSWAYGLLRGGEPHDLYVLLGTSHSTLPHPFCLTLKDYVTPLGRAETDRELAGRLLSAASMDLLAGEWTHRFEHSIEFQVVFLQHAFPGRQIRVLPILCGNILADGTGGLSNGLLAQADEFLEILARSVQDQYRRPCFIAGADLAHMGPRFGDPEPVSAELLAWLRQEDLRLLEKVEALQAVAFLEEIVSDRDRRRVCGVSSIYAALRSCGASRGQLLRYGQAPDPEGLQVVSFASLAFYG